MKMFLVFLFFIYLNYISCSILCPKTNKGPPLEILINESYVVNPVKYLDENYTAIRVGNRVFLNRANGKLNMNSESYYQDYRFCPQGFKIPHKEDFESVLK